MIVSVKRARPEDTSEDMSPRERRSSFIQMNHHSAIGSSSRIDERPASRGPAPSANSYAAPQVRAQRLSSRNSIPKP